MEESGMSPEMVPIEKREGFGPGQIYTALSELIAIKRNLIYSFYCKICFSHIKKSSRH